MTIHTGARIGAASLIAAALVGCGPSQDAQRAKDSAVAAAAQAAQAKVISQAGEVLTARREAQAHLDSARTAFVARNMASASASLREAATFARAHADSAAEPAKKALVSSAVELDALAARVAKKGVRSVSTLDDAFARLNLAEAQLHCTRALDAWKDQKTGVTAAEIVMITDHFERAAADANVKLDSAAKQSVTVARAVANKLSQGAAVPAGEVDSALTALDKAIHAPSKFAKKIQE
jgi:hypothetical protein